MADPLLPPMSLTPTLGAIEIGAIFSVFMLGILTAQVYNYARRFWNKDSTIHRLLVGVVWSMEISSTIATCYEIYSATITHFGSVEDVFKIFPGLAYSTVTATSVTLLVQGFVCHRLFRVLPRPYCYISFPCFTLSTLCFAAAVYLGKSAMHTANVADYLTTNGWLLSSILAVGAGVDVVIAGSMLWYLRNMRRDGLERLTQVIDKLTEYTVRSGALTGLCAVTTLILFQCIPSNWTWLSLYLVLSKLYSTALLSTLNSRVDIRDILSNATGPPINQASKHCGNHLDPRSLHFNYATRNPISIEIHTTTRTVQDTSDIDQHSDIEKRSDSSGTINFMRPYLSE